jgi:diguanylate cyclase (GGDEF)-like protein
MIDFRTLIALLASAEVVLAVALWMGAARRTHGIVPWVLGLGVRALAFAIVLAAAQPRAGALALCCGLVALSATLQGAAIMAFAKRQLPTWVHTAAFAVVAVPMQMLANDASTSTAELAACAALIGATLAFLLLHATRADAEATRLATTDPLTGAFNRRTFHEIAEREMSRARRANQPLSIIMLDIDHLRRLNDDYGQRAGDEVLQRFADLVRTALRKEDMLVRFAGEEFLVMLPEVSGPGAVVVAGRIRRAVADAPIEAAGHLLQVTVSLGVAARLDEGPESVDGLVARAESALQLAKQRGRNRVVALSLGRSIAA